MTTTNIKSTTLKEISAGITTITQTLMEKLSCIQNELKAPKSQYNSFGKYNYRNCEDILEAVKPLCMKYRTTLIVSDEIQVIGTRIYVMAIATIKDWDSENATHTTAYARESETKKGMDDSQITGSTSSYARKYALNGLFNIDDTKDSDFKAKEDTAPLDTVAPIKQGSKTIPQQPIAQEPTIMDLTILWDKQRKRMGELGIDFRSENIEGWILKTIKSTTQDSTQDLVHMNNLTQAYQKLIDKKEGEKK